MGERVVISGKTSRVLGAALLVYMLPLLFFFGFYLIAQSASLPQGLCVLLSFLGLAVGVLAVVLLGRRRREMRYEISAFLR